MVNRPPIDSTLPGRVREASRGARSHADAAAGPQSMVSRPCAPATKHGSSRPRVHSPEQPFEPSPRSKRSHLQERVPAVTNASSPTPQPFVGIDVSKEFLDTARSDQLPRTWRLGNDAPGVARLVAMLREIGPACIVVESTGGLERPLLSALLEAGLPVALVNPGRVRHLAMGLGILAKTDALDARVLARFAELATPRLLEKRPAIAGELDALVTCRAQLVKSRTEQSNRRQTAFSKNARKALDAVLATLDRQIVRLDAQIRDLIDSDDQWKHIDDIIQSAPGAGKVLAAALLSGVPELGKIEHRQLAALIGVAPLNRDSGRFKGSRAIQGGRADVRSVLFMATVAAMRCNPLIKALGQRLLAQGKRWKVAVVACMHKFLKLLNVMVRDNITWNQLDLVKNA